MEGIKRNILIVLEVILSIFSMATISGYDIQAVKHECERGYSFKKIYCEKPIYKDSGSNSVSASERDCYNMIIEIAQLKNLRSAEPSKDDVKELFNRWWESGGPWAGIMRIFSTKIFPLDMDAFTVDMAKADPKNVTGAGSNDDEGLQLRLLKLLFECTYEKKLFSFGFWKEKDLEWFKGEGKVVANANEVLQSINEQYLEKINGAFGVFQVMVWSLKNICDGLMYTVNAVSKDLPEVQGQMKDLNDALEKSLQLCNQLVKFTDPAKRNEDEKLNVVLGMGSRPLQNYADMFNAISNLMSAIKSSKIIYSDANETKATLVLLRGIWNTIGGLKNAAGCGGDNWNGAFGGKTVAQQIIGEKTFTEFCEVLANFGENLQKSAGEA
ncbi:MAG: hypothetical protein LBH49_02150, partial [Puniceicoccales bacterium]|nr:hypothetical protein [Puniceicoccales bacterium]